MANELTAFSNAEAFEAAQRMAKALGSSTLVPQMYQGAQNIGNAIIALEMAQRMGAAPLLIMQNLYIVHGQPSWSAKFLIATFNQSNKYEPISYEWKGDPQSQEYGCRAVSKFLATGKEIRGPWIDWHLVKAEGWDSKNGSKWRTMPEKMFMYRAAAWMIDTVAPELSMGLPTAEDAADYIDVNPHTGEVITHGSSASELEQALQQTTAPTVAQEHAPDVADILKQIDGCTCIDNLILVEDLAREIDGRTKEGKAIAAAIEAKAQQLNEQAPA